MKDREFLMTSICIITLFLIIGIILIIIVILSMNDIEKEMLEDIQAQEQFMEAHLIRVITENNITFQKCEDIIKNRETITNFPNYCEENDILTYIEYDNQIKPTNANFHPVVKIRITNHNDK